MNKEKQKQLLIEIIEADAKDGLYNLTVVEWLFDELKKHNLLVKPYTKGVNSLFEKAKEMEKEQIIDAYCDGNPQFKDCGEEYYDESYKK